VTLAKVDWKKGETPSGPPQEIRVAVEQIRSDIGGAGFVGIREHPVLPYHTFVTGKKPVPLTKPVPGIDSRNCL